MLDLPDETIDIITDIGHAIWMDAFASGVLTGARLFLPDEAAHTTAEEVVNAAVIRPSLAEVVRGTIDDRIIDYRCSHD